VLTFIVRSQMAGQWLLSGTDYEWYYAAFIRDPDGNRIEAVAFVLPA